MGDIKEKTMSLLKSNTTKAKHVNNLYRGRKESRKDVRNLFRIKQENEVISDRIIRYIKNLFELEDYHKPVRVGSFHSNNYVKFESNDDRNKTLSIEE